MDKPYFTLLLTKKYFALLGNLGAEQGQE